MNKFELMAVKTPSKMPSAELFWQFYNYCFIARELDSFKGTIEHHLPHWFSDHCKFWKNLTYPILMLCLNSLTRGLSPLGPLLLPERPMNTIRHGWGKFCSISPIKYSVCLPVYSCLKTKLNLQNWSYNEKNLKQNRPITWFHTLVFPGTSPTNPTSDWMRLCPRLFAHQAFLSLYFFVCSTLLRAI